MTVGLLLLELHIPGSRSLKDKRRALTSLTERLRRRFNASLCEVEHRDKWQHSRIAVTVVNTQSRVAESTLQRITEFVEQDRRVSVIDARTEQIY